MAILVVVYDTATGGFRTQKIGSAQIGDGAIVSGKIAGDAIGNLHLRSGDVQHARLGGVTANLHHVEFTSGMHNFAHPSALIGAGAIISAKIPANAIGGGHILDGSIESADLANQAVLSGKLGSGQVALGHITSALRDPITTIAGLRTLGAGAQQAAAGNHTHTLAEDIVGSAYTAITQNSLSTAVQYYYFVLIPATTASATIATKTQSYATTSMAVATVAGSFWCSSADSMKLRLYMNGVQVAESAYLPAAFGAGAFQFLQGTRALSGSIVCYFDAYNYGAVQVALDIDGTISAGICACGIAIGSIKL